MTNLFINEHTKAFSCWHANNTCNVNKMLTSWELSQALQYLNYQTIAEQSNEMDWLVIVLLYPFQSFKQSIKQSIEQ